MAEYRVVEADYGEDVFYVQVLTLNGWEWCKTAYSYDHATRLKDQLEGGEISAQDDDTSLLPLAIVALLIVFWLAALAFTIRG